MSSSNRVSLAAIPETDYGVIPPAGDFTALKFTSEALTGTPKTVESSTIRSDRQNSGQVNTGLEVSGLWNFELSGDPSFQTYLEQAMMSDAIPVTADVLDLTIDVTAGTITTTNSFTAEGFADGDFITLSDFVNAENNTIVVVSNVTALVMDFVGEGLVDESAPLAKAHRAAYFEVGTIKKSTAIVKEFLDIDTPNIRSITYLGQRVSEMAMNFAFGEIVTGSFTMAGNGHDTPTVPETDGRTVNQPGDDEPLDASNGFGWLLVDGQDIDICIENLSFTLSNNLQPQNCIGKEAPKNQIPGSAAISFEANMHLGPTSFDIFMPAKKAQTPMSLAYYTRDASGKGYGVDMFRVQFTGDDPASAGKDEQVMLTMTGTGSKDSSRGNSLRIYVFE